MKGNIDHTIPLTPYAQQHLPTSPFAGAVTIARRNLQNALPQIPHWTPHDFRRYFSSTMARLGIPQEVTERLLAHKTGGKLSPIAAVYNRYDYLEPMQNALTRYEEHLFSFLERTEKCSA